MELTESYKQSVIDTGKASLELAVEAGDSYLPKLLVEIGGELTLVGYEGGWESLVALKAFFLSAGKPITAICNTTDSYVFVGGPGGEDPEQYVGKLGQLFDAGDKRVSEALQITIVTEDACINGTFPYVRYHGGTRLQWTDSPTDDASAVWQGSGVEVGGRLPDLFRAIIEDSKVFA